VTVFGRQAQTVVDYLAKGRRIGVDGRLSWREWQAQDGSKRQSVEVVANDIFFLDSRQDGDGGGGTQRPADDLAPPPVPRSTAPADDDEIPF
jgi:single-strand DNA-binding protein